jgi:GMP synthase (glutamine-hydrolysing)
MHSHDRRILVLQHAEPEHLGRIADALSDACVEYTYLRADLGHPIPSTLDGYQGLIVMGGPQSVYEEERYPFLGPEKALVRHAVLMKRPVLGVCLGSQLIAEVLGSRVYPGAAPELGWKEVRISAEAALDPILGHLPPALTPLHWHGDIYDLPDGATPLGSSELAPVQGFSWKQQVYGLLFHLEMTLQQLIDMTAEFPDDLTRAGTTRDALLADSSDKFAALAEISLEVFRRWTTLL